VALIDLVAELLEKHSIAFAVIGASALATHGVSRSTFDIDLLTVDTQVLSEPFWEPIRSQATVDVRRGDFDDPLRGVVRILPSSGRSIDIVVGKWKWERAAIDRAQLVSAGERSLPVVTAADLVLLKLAAGGSTDAWDIGRLLSVVGAEAVAEVEQRLPDLRPDARALWERIRAGA
jgi:hypothetical protein